ncbi:MAG: STAS domain-containing protein [Armatimonadetes bacterium]|nr:STAS domain-containing protein [Armatimonadota bacterium]
MADLTVKVIDGDPPVVALAGEVDLATAPMFEDAILALLKRGKESVAVDLGRVSYLDSTGVSVLMKAVKRCRKRGGDLVVVGISDRALRVMRLLNLDRVVRFRPNGARMAA